MRERRALRRARRARRELDVDRVAGLQGRLALGELARRRPGRPSARNASQSSLEHDRVERRPGAPARASRRSRSAEARRHDQQADAGLAQRVLQLGRLVGGVDRDEDRADAGGRELRHDPLVAVRRPDPDAVALAHAARQQRARRPVDLLPQLGVGRAVALVGHDERFPVREALGGLAQVLADRLLEQRDVARPSA